MTRARALFALLLTASIALADIPFRPVTSDLDAEFARAADLLEQGDRASAEAVLTEIRRTADQRAWNARVALLLAADDERRKDFASAEARLRAAQATSIGLEPYRRERLGRVLEAAGKGEAAIGELRSAFESEEPFARRTAVGRELARALEKAGRPREALAVLARAAAGARSGDSTAIGIERVRLGLAVKDPAAVAAAARELLLRAPSADVTRSTPTSVRAVLKREEKRLTAPARARRGRALVAAGDARRGHRLLSESRASWPPADRPANQLALARALSAVGRAGAAESAAALVPVETPESFPARLLRADLLLARLRKTADPRSFARSPRSAPVRDLLESVVVASAPASARAAALERLVRLSSEAGDFDGALAYARTITSETRGTVRGFEPAWDLAWERWRAGDFAGARRRFEGLAATYDEIWRDRRLTYWRARCLEKEKRSEAARTLYARLAAGNPPDIYALFARRRFRGSAAPAATALADPSTETAEFRRTDELLRLRMFAEAAAEAGALHPSRGRDLRIAEADFALGRFPSAATAAKRAFPEIGTAEEARVPDGWRRLHYPVEEGGFLPARASEFHLDPAVLRALVRQESVFVVGAKSHAGALGLTQLMPGTAKPLARSVLRVRYRRAFLYDPGVNARLGAAYLRQLLDRFGGNVHYALAAYNGGPARMSRVLQDNRGRAEDEILESHPFHETRDYVRRVLLYAESYRELYPTR
ncbi:MAG TPA: transglycosylase SLT domain-containing protein [Thermoanaerobaculia bacterium]|jgi:soluble lytic murein transglycosylase-like protein|nr:transglycosylase SLT domain-containing protein [Thermoanaerobaculia bacterium]